MRIHIFNVLVLIVLISACAKMSVSPSMAGQSSGRVTQAPVPSGALRRGLFTSFEHSLAGAAALYVDAGDMKFISLEGFTMTQGPDVRVFISRSNNFSVANTIEIATLARTYATEDIDIPVATYAEEYRFVLVYCLQFHSLFGYAELK